MPKATKNHTIAKRVHSTPQRIKSSRKSKGASKSNEAGRDLDLLKLGRQLDLLVQRYETARQRFIPVNEAHKRLIAKWCQAHPGYNNDQVSAAYCEIYDDLREGIGEHPDDAMGEVDGVSRAIVAIPATTIAGLAVKARLAAFANEGCWDDSDEDADWEVLVVRKLVDAVIRLAASSGSDCGSRTFEACEISTSRRSGRRR